MKSENHSSILKEIISGGFQTVAIKQTKTQTGDVCGKQTFKPGARRGMENVRVRLAAFFRQVRPMWYHLYGVAEREGRDCI
jgi:hypothetical protein